MSLLEQDKRGIRMRDTQGPKSAVEERIGKVNRKEEIWHGRPVETYFFGCGFRSQGSNWLGWSSAFWAVDPALAQTPFDAGRRRAISESSHAMTHSNRRPDPFEPKCSVSRRTQKHEHV
jgi:hypothetical protein